MPVTKSVFDVASDTSAYTLTNSTGRLKVTILDYGATIQSVIVPDREGVERDVVLGFDDLDGYQNKRPPLRNPYFGATIGRVANRIGNAAFELNGQRYQLTANSGALSLHSGPQGFDKRKWSLVGEVGENSLTLEHLAADGESGFPGALRVRITFSVTSEGELKIDYKAVLEGDKDLSTVVNLTNHTYFNLNGVSGSGEASSILKHKVLMRAASFIEVDDSLVPTGKVLPVEGTKLDFTGHARTVEERVYDVKPAGYDHCYVIEADEAKWAQIAPAELKQGALVVWSPLSGIKLEMATTEPGFQFYTGSKIMEGHKQKASQGAKKEPLVGPYSGFCAEASRFPDAPNQWPAQVVLAPGKEYRQTTVYKFGLASEL